jgi:uncharacterized membrane protein YozB (DUF420 family)
MEYPSHAVLPPSATPHRGLGRILFAVFVLALAMGAGPGLYLVNPDPTDPEAKRFLFGVPVVYAWAVFWITVQAGSVVAAWYWIWRKTSEEASPMEGGNPS